MTIDREAQHAQEIAARDARIAELERENREIIRRANQHVAAMMKSEAQLVTLGAGIEIALNHDHSSESAVCCEAALDCLRAALAALDASPADRSGM